MPEAMLPSKFNFVKIAGDFIGRWQSFRQSPLERIVPKVSCNSTERLLDNCRAPQNVLTAGMKRQRIRFSRRLSVEQLGRGCFDQFVRIAVEPGKLPVKTFDEFVH